MCIIFIMTLPETYLINEAIEKKSEDIALELNEGMEAIKDLSEGERRAAKGKLTEKISKKICREAADIAGVSEDRLDINSLKIPYDHLPKNQKGELLLSEIKESKKNSKKNYGIGSDVFIYLDGSLAFAMEVKTYCDTSMFKRAHAECESLVAISQKHPTFLLLQCENALGGEAHENSVCSDTFKTGANIKAYLWNRKRLLGERSPKFNILTMRNAKRCSKKEICKEKTPFMKERIGEILRFMVGAFKNKLEENA